MFKASKNKYTRGKSLTNFISRLSNSYPFIAKMKWQVFLLILQILDNV